MSYKILIVDDEPLARKVIYEFLEKMDQELIITEANDALTAQKILTSSNFDLIYLDINMPLMTGLELASSYKGASPKIFTTAYAEHAVEAFELAAFDYLVKPISFSRFQKSFQRALEHLSTEQTSLNAWLMIKEGKRIYTVPYAEILYLQAYGDYVKIFTDKKTYLMKVKLSSLLDELPEQFVRSHRSYVVGIEQIKYKEGNHVFIAGEKIPISDGNRESLMKRL